MARLTRRQSETPVFAFFSSRLGCLGSVIVSIIGTLLLLVVLNLVWG